MPAASPVPDAATASRLQAVGGQLRARRKRLGVNAATAAQAAGMSRVTLHRIERGEPSVTMGAYFNAAAALGLELGVTGEPVGAAANIRRASAGHLIRLATYPQLKHLAWQFQRSAEVTPEQALSLYERNWRHVDQDTLASDERALIQDLVATLGGGRLLV